MNEKPEVLIMKYKKFLYLEKDFELYNSAGKKVISMFLNDYNDYLEMPVKKISKVVITNESMTIFAFDNEIQISFEMKENEKIKKNEFWKKK